MVRYLLFPILLITFFFGFNINNASANHIPGANITYTCDPANPLTYTFTLTLFRRCPGTHPATMSAANFTLTNTCGLTNPVVPTFNQVGAATDVNQLCSSVTSNCSGGTQPGVWLYTYEAIITLPADCDSWNLAFELCCRDQSTNLTGAVGNSMATSTTMNTATSPCNNSPVVTSAPIPYACINTNFSYCLTIADPEGDSTYFSMVAPAGAGQAPITYLAGYSVTSPLTGFVLDPLTGCMTFNEPNIGNYVAAVQINSYDAAGNLVASIVHDFQFQVVNCTNTPPVIFGGGITNFVSTSATQTGPSTIAACYGDLFCFDVVFQDLVDVGDNITIVQDGTTLLPSATFTQTGTNPVSGTFCWTSQPGATGNVITFVAEDDGCPLIGSTGFAVNLDIGTGVYAGPDQIICGTQSAQLQGFGAGSYTWSPSAGLSCTSCPNPVATPAVTTTYTVTGNLAGSCSNVDAVTVNVVSDFTLNITPANSSICVNEVVQLTANGQAGFGPFVYSWTPSSTLNNDSIANPLASPITTTTYTATVIAANGCTKQTTANVTVSGIGPTVTITPSDTDICAGESVPLVTSAFVYPLTCGISTGCTGTSSSVDIGTAATGTTTYTPFYGSTSTTTNYTNKSQFIYTAAELNAMGYFGGTIETLALYFTTSYTYQYDNFDIWMGCTSQDEYLTTTFIPTGSLTQVYGVNNFNPTNASWNTFNITDWDWDGTSNLVIQMCASEDNNNASGSESVRYSTTSPAYRCVYDHTTTTASCNELTGSRITNRPNMRFGMCVQSASSPSYSWVPATGLNNANIANPTATPVFTTSYLLNVTASGCTGSAIANVNVSPNYTLAPAASPISLCYGTSTTLSSNPSGAGPYTYSWTPAGAFASPTSANPTVTPTGTTTYYVSTSNGFCNKMDSVTINVAGFPTVASTSKDTVCAGETVNLNVVASPLSCGVNYSICSGATTTGTSGTGTTSSSIYGPFYGSPSTSLFYTHKKQFIFTAAELTAMGFTAGTITELALDVSTSTGRSYGDFYIYMGCTNQSEFLTTAFIPTSSLAQVYYNSNYTTALGWNAFNITGFDWDGTSNIVIQFCANNAEQSGSESVRYTTTTPAYRFIYDNTSSTTAPSCPELTGSRITNRPNVRFKFCSNSLAAGSTFNWTSTTGLSNPNIQAPTATIAGDINYTITIVDPSNPGCPNTANVSVYVDNRNSVVASNDTAVCAGDPVQLNSIFNGPNVPITLPCGISAGCTQPSSSFDIGTSTSSFSTYSPFYGSSSATINFENKIQMIFTPAEMNAMGYTGGTIQDIALYVTSTSGYQYDNVNIWIGCSAQDKYLNTTFIPTSSLTQVYGPVNNVVAASNAWHVFNITDWDWDGTSNIVIQICTKEGSFAGNSLVRYTSTSPDRRFIYDHTSTTTSCNELTGTQVANRPNVRFTVCDAPPTPLTYTWSPIATLSNSTISNPIATPGAAETYVVATTGGYCTVYDTVNVLMCTPLPITLTSFAGKCKTDNTILLEWATASEINNDYFTLERSNNAIDYVEIAKINGAGNSNTTLIYHSIDFNPLGGTNYYRLKQTDFNGEFEYFNIVAVENCAIKTDEISIYPNPVTNNLQLTISSVNDANASIKIYDLLGNIVQQETLTPLKKGSNKININVERLPKAMYVLVLEKEGQQYQLKFTK
jgi:Secretion system C-terminal sorting domain